jgi:hypothetical protein
MIANDAKDDTWFYLRLTANKDGSMAVFNPRNKFEKKYPAK